MKGIISLSYILLYLLPGVALGQKNLVLNSSITSVQTSIPVFIGYSETAIQRGRDVTGRSVRIKSFTQYQQIYGGAQVGFYLCESVHLFFQNGGRECYIISVGESQGQADLTILTKGLEASRKVPAQLVLVPDAVNLQTNEFHLLQQRMLAICATQQDRFAILNTQQPTANAQQDIQSFRSGISNANLKWGAVYYPWLVLQGGTAIPPSGAITGIYADIDINRGVWKAPANVSVSGIQSLSQNLNQGQRDFANISPSDGKSVNTIAHFTGRGILVWGSRTLAGNDNEWRYVPVRRFATMLEQSVRKGLSKVVFEPNDANTWTGVKTAISTYMTGLWRDGALQGTKPSQAFFAKCGQGETMTVQDLKHNRLIVDIGFAPVRPAEFIVIRMEWKMK